MKALLSKRQDVVLLIVGGGPARGSLEQLAKELGIERSVRFAGMVNPNEVADYYKLGDIFTCASTSETQGLTYIEAMASGLPLVCRKDPCLYGVLEEGGNGYSYESIQQFVSGVQRLWKKRKYLKMRDSTAGKSQKSMEQNDLESVWKAAMKKYYWKESVRKMKCCYMRRIDRSS
mgnify:CR=1 FL=1